MTPAEIDRVFGRGRLRMTTGEHVEVFREEARDGEERRYTKRFLETANGDLRAWTEREWRILDRLGARGDAAVARVVRFFPADESGMARLQTRDAGPTVDEWAALVPLRRTSPVLPYVFGDCANWWALARQCLLALDPLHALGFVHLDLKADNVCVPWQPAQAGRPAAGQQLAPDFEGLALIDVAFSLLPEIELPGPLPLAREPGYEYQSSRLLHALDEGRRGNLAPTLELDWRCDLFSLAAMLWRYLPELDDAAGTGWSSQRHASATAFVRQLLDIHGNALTAERPHRELIGQAALRLTEPQLAAALQAGSNFDPERAWPHGAEATPLTRVVSMPAMPRAAVQRREPMFETPTPLPARPTSMPPSTPTPTPTPASASASASQPTPKSAASTPTAPGVPPATSARMTAPVATTAEAPVARSAPAPAQPAGSVAAAIGGAVARPSGAPSVALAAAALQAATATPITARAGQGIEPSAASATRSPPPASPTPSVARSPTPIAPSSARLASPGPARNATPPPMEAPTTHRAPPPALERPRAPTTPVPILAAAGAGALLVALAAWWGLDGRAMFDRMAERRAAAAAAPGASVATARSTRATAPADASSNATIAAAAPSSAAQSTSAPTMAAARPASAPAALSEPPATSTSEPTEQRAEAQPNVAGELEANAADWMQNRLPRISQAAERQLASAMGSAARSAELRRRSDIRAAVQAARSSAAVGPDVPVRAGEARTLNDAALVAYWRDNSVPDALRLQTQAFGANPLDAEVVGNLAFLRLKEKPPQAEAARQLALHALMLKDARFPYGRIDDWTTLAIADALTGRDKDARNAWFVSMALANDLQRQCNAAVSAEATYGERLRPSVQAMLQRARSSAAYGRCEVAQAAAPATQRKPARPQVKSKSTQKPRRAIP